MRKSLIVLSLVFIMAGCAGSQAPPPEETPPVHTLSSRSGNSKPVNSKAAVATRAQTDRLIKARAEVKLAANHPDSVHCAVIHLSDRYEGHLLYSDLNRTTVRLPQHRLFAALAEIESLGKLRDRKITGGDITEQYKAISNQLAQLIRQRKRLLAEIERAQNPSYKKELEDQLDTVDTAIAQLGLNQDAEAHGIYYALVKVETSEPTKAGPLGWVLSNAFTGIKKLFVLN